MENARTWLAAAASDGSSALRNPVKQSALSVPDFHVCHIYMSQSGAENAEFLTGFLSANEVSDIRQLAV
jgi:hypothetical protein